MNRINNNIEDIGIFINKKIVYLGGLAILIKYIIKDIRNKPVLTKELKEQCLSIGVASLPIALITVFFVGVVFAFQFGFTLRALGAVQFIGRVTSVSLIRELGPVFTALVVGGRIGAGISAEIGSMKVTEQLDAIYALGANPINKLIVPRIIATTLMLPLVTIIATFMGELGALFISFYEFGLSPVSFYGTSVSTVRMFDLISGLTKTFFFGFGISLVGCYEGLNCQLGTKAVGIATTKAVVNVSLVIVFVDFFLTRLFAFFL